MIPHLSSGRMIELVAAVVILGLSVWQYRSRRPRDDRSDQGYGSQGAVILLVIGAIMAVHALGLMEYRPSKAEAEMMRDRAR